MIKLFISFGIFIFTLNSVNTENTNQWLGTKQLNENYVMFWKRDDLKEELVIRVEVKTRGWVGFGFSRHGEIEQMDLIIGWVTDEGKTYFHDRWTDRKDSQPVIDKSQDWHLISGLQNTSHTVLQFKRPYKTCDTLEDVEVLETEDQNIIWSYSHTDPISDQNIPKHDAIGAIHLRLLNPVVIIEPQEDDLEIYDLRLNNLTVPNKPIAYFCQFFKYPFENPKQIVKCGQNIEPPEMAKYVYHTGLSHIDPLYPDIIDQYLGQSFECKDLPSIILDNMSVKVFTPCETAVRIADTYYAPPDGGIKIASEPYNRYMMLQVHLENKDGSEGNIVSPAMRLWLTGQLRAHDLDLMIAGASNNFGYTGIGIMIPPREPRFLIRSLNDLYCFQNRMDRNGITLDSIYVHTHEFATEVYSKLIRDNKEIPLLSYTNYDTRNQVFHRFNKSIKILPGDRILTICAFNSSMETQMLIGKNEMCASNIIFWPPFTRTNNTVYGNKILPGLLYETNKAYTAFKYETILKITNLEEIEGYYEYQTPIVRRPIQYNGTSLFDYIKHKREWLPAPQIEKYLWESDQRIYCQAGYEPPAIRPTQHSIPIEMIKNYTPFEEKYRFCKSSCSPKGDSI